MRVALFLLSLVISCVSGQTVEQILSGVALNGGSEFNNPDSYQSQALAYVENFKSGVTAGEMHQYYALACVYYATYGKSNKRTDVAFPQLATDNMPGWRNADGWVTAADKCSWHGISCDGNFVSQIQLPDNRLFGMFPPEISILAGSLEVLDIYLNFYLVTEGDAGNQWIEQMTNLRELFFGTTSFEYDGIPTFIGALTKLEEIDVSNTFYTRGDIPAEAFSELSSLTYIDMADNIYTSSIPTEISNLPDLLYLYIDNVNFLNVDQSLDFLIGMPSIYESWMDFTAFVGGLPTEMGDLSTLRSFSCCFCGLSGPIPTQIGNMAALDRFWVYQNDLTGSIPSELGNLDRMIYLHVEGNDLTGAMPTEICGNRVPIGLITELGADCDGTISCAVGCCTCCGGEACDNFSDGTPSPTIAPTPGGPPVEVIPIPAGFCFSGNSVVETANGFTPLNKLQVGDMVKNGDKFEQLYSFGHYDNDAAIEFVQIHADGLEQPLELSSNHMIFVEGGAKPASTVVVGDRVSLANGGFSNVVKIESVFAQGVYAPLTTSGKIAVNGFLASSYVTFQPDSDSLLIGGLKVINMHWVSHIFTAPHRLVCQFNLDICKAETHTSGLNSWFVVPLGFTLDVLERNAFVQAAVFVPFFSVVCVAFLFESIIASPVLLALGIATVFLFRRNKKTIA